MCSACAGNAADIYIKHPQSRCGSVVAAALAGDERSIAELQCNPDYCIKTSFDSAGVVNAAVSATPAANKVQPAVPLVPVAASKPVTLIEIALAIAGILYFIPTLIGLLRRKRNAPAIPALNLFLGWTFLGWVGALVWSLMDDAIPSKETSHHG